MTQLWQLSATELAKLVRQREVSAREVANAVLDRLDAVNPARPSGQNRTTGFCSTLKPSRSTHAESAK
ncbi:hypothetical protein L2Y90_24905 [Burkholderia pyrrocinia]|uniref:hypothetical protein n=1 Tax=Burkholderia pyrrocinia TaxID=60550 RepID=UPI00215A3B11|nr:hypothetical protein [Burkholderia pyrrocinia]UVE69945.1 hypothetical protein L2Y90_24905 [Burkholderia pyrrocinia]